ncbi:MAG: hypothetical protein KA163_11100 [Bacteroidia bacterium]|nr:hypothetical protein [Bacteroidia bacterium]
MANIIEIGDLVKYKNIDNPSGPVYSILKGEVRLIHYKNGTVDEFKVEKSLPSSPTTIENTSPIKKERNVKLLSIYTNIPKNMLAEYNLGLEFGINKWIALGVAGGVVHTSEALDPLPLSPSQDRWPGTVYQGYALRANVKIYTAGTLSDYWNFQILGKTLSYNNHEFTDKVYEGNHYDNFVTYKRSEEAIVLGFSIMHGHEYASANGFLYIDFFYGFGIRYRERRINTIETRTIYYASKGFPDVGYTEQFQTFPIIETGFKIGFNFQKMKN